MSAISPRTTSTTTSEPATPSALRRLMCGHPLVAYFAIAYAGTWLVLSPLLLGKDGLGLLPYKIGDAAILVVFLSAFTGPTLGALLVTAATSGKSGVHRFLRRYIQWRAGVSWYLLALFSFFAIFLLSVCIPLGLGPLTTFLKQWQLVMTTFVPLVIVFTLTDALGEEPGWRGFALPRLQRRYGPVVGTVVLGTLHSFWHLPTGFVNGGALYPFTWVTFATFMLTGIAGTFIFTWIYNNVKGSILIAILIHAASNASTAVVSAALPAHPSLGPVESFLFNYNGDLVIGFGVVAILLVVFTRGRLGYHAEQNASLIYEDPELAAQPTVPALQGQ